MKLPTRYWGRSAGWDTRWLVRKMQGSIRQRSPGSWELAVELGRDEFGRRRRRYRTVRGTKAHARRELRKFLSALDRGMGLPDERILLRDWLDRWMREVVVPRRSQGTKERYRAAIDVHIVPAIGHVPLGRLSPPHIQALESDLLTRMSSSGVQLVHAVLSGALKHALRMELVNRNPVPLVSPPPSSRRAVTPPDIAAVRAALELAREERHPHYACIHLVAYTGLRRGEVLGLMWPNVDLDRGHLTIEGSLVLSRELGLVLDRPKTASGRRTVDLDVGTVQVLAEHRVEQQHTIRMLDRAYVNEGRVFASADGGWVKPMQLTRAVKQLGARVGRPEMTVRSLRHFHASVALQAGQNIVVVSKRLGHANVSITSDIYAHSLPGWQKEAADAFADAMKGSDQAVSRDPQRPASEG